MPPRGLCGVGDEGETTSEGPPRRAKGERWLTGSLGADATRPEATSPPREPSHESQPLEAIHEPVAPPPGWALPSLARMARKPVGAEASRRAVQRIVPSQIARRRQPVEPSPTVSALD